MARRTLVWAYLTRARSERDLVEELGEAHLPDVLAEGIVVSAGRPEDAQGAPQDPAFARQGMRLDGPPARIDPETIADRLARAMAEKIPRAGTWALQVLAPDSNDPRDPRRRIAAELEPALAEALESRLRPEVRDRRTGDGGRPDHLVQVWIADEAQALVGVTSIHEAITAVPGGKLRMKRPEDAPSRAGLKLEEAIDWIGLGPEKGDLCADLGAAPGGWSQVAVGRGATVIAVDPANVKVNLPRGKFTHVQESAFDFAPSETLDWLLCDMAWRPLEVAQLVAKWGRRVWARQLIANFKLPMKRKAEILARIRDALENAGWRGLRARQLYFDRDEVTIFAWLDPQVAKRGVQAPFELRSRKNRTRSTRVQGRAGQRTDDRPREERREGRAPRGRADRGPRGRGRARGGPRRPRGRGPKPRRSR